MTKMLSLITYKPGASTVLTSEEEEMVVGRLIFAAKRGFAVGKESLKSLMIQIASDGRPIWKGGELPMTQLGLFEHDIEN